jgi:hypothetical protein
LGAKISVGIGGGLDIHQQLRVYSSAPDQVGYPGSERAEQERMLPR